MAEVTVVLEDLHSDKAAGMVPDLVNVFRMNNAGSTQAVEHWTGERHGHMLIRSTCAVGICDCVLVVVGGTAGILHAIQSQYLGILFLSYGSRRLGQK